ncbi:MAG: type IV pilin N-terminal domain-containing protein [Methanoregula sp.]
MKNFSESAVSPVVGVMLMLVVTIIIAAVVSMYAGGMSTGTEKASQVQIRATYSQSEGLKIEHMGGDAIATGSTTIWVRCSDTFGSATHAMWQVNKTTLVNSQTGAAGAKDVAWLRDAGYSGVKSFVAGDTVYVNPPYHTNTFLQPGVSATYMFDSPSNIGKTFFVELTDKDGKMFGRTEVTISS